MPIELEYFDERLKGQRGILLLYGGSPLEVESLRSALHGLTVVDTSISLHSLAFLEPVDDCRLIAASVSKGRGVQWSSADAAYRWSLSPTEWEETSSLLEPFCEPTPGQADVRFQYLNPNAGLEVIYSTARAW